MQFNLKNIFTPEKRTAAFGVLSLLVFIGVLFLVFPALAQQDALAQLGAQSGLPQTSLPILIARIIRVVLGVIGIVLVVLIVYGGFLWMTSAGEPEKVSKAKMVLQNAVIGFVIIMSSFGITQFILSRLLEAAGLGGGISSRAEQFYEPLSGSLGAGIIQDHFPNRNALDIARNTKIFVTFKEPINPASIIEGYESDPEATNLNTASVKIYPTADGEEAALGQADVLLAVDETFQTFVFDPIPFLGDGLKDVNYTVFLTPNIQKADGSSAFTGRESDGYSWTFEVGTQIDLTPPKVVSVIPSETGGPFARNITVSLTFNEAMDPVASTGEFDGGGFTNISVLAGGTDAVHGTFAISNGYRTVDFTSVDACGQDPCGDTIYCLPGPAQIEVLAKAAELGDEPPQARAIGVSYNGLVDAAGNSLDGDADGAAQGPDADNYAWNFDTTNTVNSEVPQITGLFPAINAGDVDLDLDVEVTFSLPMKASTLNSENVRLYAEPYHSLWFNPRTVNLSVSGQVAGLGEAVDHSQVRIEHPTFVPPDLEPAQSYYPVITNGVKSSYQICLYPAMDNFSNCDSRSHNPNCCNGQITSQPYCCYGVPSPDACDYLIE